MTDVIDQALRVCLDARVALDDAEARLHAANLTYLKALRDGDEAQVKITRAKVDEAWALKTQAYDQIRAAVSFGQYVVAMEKLCGLVKQHRVNIT